MELVVNVFICLFGDEYVNPIANDGLNLCYGCMLRHIISILFKNVVITINFQVMMIDFHCIIAIVMVVQIIIVNDDYD